MLQMLCFLRDNVFFHWPTMANSPFNPLVFASPYSEINFFESGGKFLMLIMFLCWVRIWKFNHPLKVQTAVQLPSKLVAFLLQIDRTFQRYRVYAHDPSIGKYLVIQIEALSVRKFVVINPIQENSASHLESAVKLIKTNTFLRAIHPLENIWTLLGWQILVETRAFCHSYFSTSCNFPKIGSRSFHTKLRHFFFSEVPTLSPAFWSRDRIIFM